MKIVDFKGEDCSVVPRDSEINWVLLEFIVIRKVPKPYLTHLIHFPHLPSWFSKQYSYRWTEE